MLFCERHIDKALNVALYVSGIVLFGVCMNRVIILLCQ